MTAIDTGLWKKLGKMAAAFTAIVKIVKRPVRKMEITLFCEVEQKFINMYLEKVFCPLQVGEETLTLGWRSSSKARDLLVNLPSHPHLWSSALVTD